jgi:CMP-N-acetylneuraminic acid synthetase
MLEFFGKPLIWYSIEFARMIGLGEKCYVSSDGDTILDYARDQNVHAIRRPESISTPVSRITDSVVHLLTYLRDIGINPEYFLLLQPTNPLRVKEYYYDLLSVISESNVDCVFTAVKCHEKTGEMVDGRFIPHNYSFETQSHHRNKMLSENGMMYLFKTSSLLLYNSLFGASAVPYQVDDIFRFTDINDEAELAVTEFIYARYKMRYNFPG